MARETPDHRAFCGGRSWRAASIEPVIGGPAVSFEAPDIRVPAERPWKAWAASLQAEQKRRSSRSSVGTTIDSLVLSDSLILGCLGSNEVSLQTTISWGFAAFNPSHTPSHLAETQH